jgi:GMP synthase-like glutamine amidotransferase
MTAPDGGARTAILYVVVDRPQDAGPDKHEGNIASLAATARTVDPAFGVVAVTIAQLAGMDSAEVDRVWRPLALFSAGTWSDWYWYGVDATWREHLDSYMALMRSTTIPLLAVCGSNELLAAAYHGFGAVAHMNDAGPPIPIAAELARRPVTSLAPNPPVGEYGTYPIAATAAGFDDPLVRATGTSGYVAQHHEQMVIDAGGFELIYTCDPFKPPEVKPDTNQARHRCRVQGVRWPGRDRLLYGVQFHPEVPEFRESTEDDGGFGARWLVAFLEAVRVWWG